MAERKAVTKQMLERYRHASKRDKARIFDELYRGILGCGICGLRMWGNHRKSSVYYSCQPSHQRAANIPADHPPHVYLGEPLLHEAVVEFLSQGLFGPDRSTY